MGDRQIVRVAVDTTALMVDKGYDYLVPPQMTDIKVGQRVLVPFGRGNKLTEALVISFPETSSFKKLKYLDSILDTEPILDDKGIKLAFHVRDRSFSTLYSVVRAMVPIQFWFKGSQSYIRSHAFDENKLRTLFSQDESIIKLIDYFCVNDSIPDGKSLEEILGYRVTPSIINRLKSENILTETTVIRQSVQGKTRKLYSLSDDGFEAFGSNLLKSSGRNKVAEFLFSVGQASEKEIIYFTGVSKSVISEMVKRSYLTTQDMEVLRRPLPETISSRQEFLLNDQQHTAYDGLCKLVDENKASCSLLHGVTGSGKTQVYMKLLDHVISSGKRGLVLVPEIALTTQLLQKFYSYFNGKIAVLHSALSVGERYDEWRRIRRGDVDVVLGTRSAVFAPVDNIGVIIVDEEHEHTYRSDMMPRYHAIDVAKYRCIQEKSLLILGSATPSVESMYKAHSGVYAYFSLTDRYGEALLPRVIVSDTKLAYKQGLPGIICPELRTLLSQTLSRGEQAILLINRRGTGKHLICMGCGYIPMCPNCSVTLKYHAVNGRLICHHCGYSQPTISVCPECGSKSLTSVGIGTQLVEKTVLDMFPNVSVIRMDSDTTSGKNSHEALISSFGRGEAQVLVGTQMIAKGLDFPNVTLCAVIDADSSLYSGDYRGAEQALAMLLQLTGRAGRGTKPGIAVIQTATPTNFVVTAARKQDYLMFYEQELDIRRSLRQPPFSKLVTLTITGTIDMEAYKAAVRVHSQLRRIVKSKNLPFDVLGPAPADVQKLNNTYRYCVTLRGTDSRELRDTVWEVLLTYQAKFYGKTSIFADSNV